MEDEMVVTVEAVSEMARELGSFTSKHVCDIFKVTATSGAAYLANMSRNDIIRADGKGEDGSTLWTYVASESRVVPESPAPAAKPRLTIEQVTPFLKRGYYSTKAIAAHFGVGTQQAAGVVANMRKLGLVMRNDTGQWHYCGA